ncbi:MAG TPA: hypothetical protein ENF94_00535 [Candidatus Woesearchaeota archaeon]|nr:hypothetical protein [Candidatus Woesearchaeota archaeon]
MYRIKVIPSFEIITDPKIYYRYVDKLAEAHLYWIRKTIKSYLRFTRRHGWKYRYTGNLAKSFQKAILDQPNTSHIRALIYSDAPQSRILEFGGTITPRRGRFLKVPVKGTPLPFQLPKNAQLTLAGRVLWFGKQPVFTLKPSVRIPAYFYLARAIRSARKEVRPLVREYIMSLLREK